MKRALAVLDRHPLLVAVATGLVWACVLAARMFLPHPVGLADQGDGHRLLCELGLRDDRPWNTPSNNYVYLTWVEHRYYGETCGANGTGEPYYSSQLALLQLARALTSILGLPGALDLRALAVVCCVIVGFALGWLLMVLPGRVALRLVVVAAIGLLFADAGVAGYFASSYSEPAALLAVLLLCPALLMFFRAEEPAWHHYLLPAALTAFAIGSKTQMVSLVPMIAAAFLWRRRADRPVTERSHRRAPYALAVTLVIGIFGFSGYYLSTQPERFAELDMYNQVFQTILPASPDPRGDLEWFGLDPELVRGSGTNVFSPDSVAADPAYATFMDKVTPVKVVLFYLSHPARLPDLLGSGMSGAAEFRLSGSYLGTNPADAGLAPEQADHRMQTYTYLFKVFSLSPVLLMGGYWVGAAIAFLAVVFHRREDRSVQAVGKLGLVLLASAAIQFWAVMLTQGQADLIKHMIVVDVCIALTVPLLLSAWFTRLRRTDRLTQAEVDDEDTDPATERQMSVSASTHSGNEIGSPSAAPR